MAFPIPQKLKGVRIVLPHIKDYSVTNDSLRVRVQGLLGWPDYWADLVDTDDMQPFVARDTMHDIIIQMDKRAFFLAYRILFIKTGDEAVRIQSLSSISEEDE